MKFIKYYFLFILSIYLSVPEKAFSSQIIWELNDDKFMKRVKVHHFYCGTPIISNPEFIKEVEENTLLLHPEIYEEMKSFRKRTALKMYFSIGDSTRFFAFNMYKTEFYTLWAELRGKGNIVDVWVEKDELKNNHVTDSVVQDIINALENSTPNSRDPSVGVIALEEKYFGDFPDINGDDRIDILILDIRDGWAGGAFMAGYFSHIDQILNYDSSNGRDMVYVDSYPTIYQGPDNYNSGLAKETVTHELQHLIHYNYDEDENNWINEGLSIYAQYLCGFDVDNVSDYLADTNRDITEIVPDLEGIINEEVIKDYHKVGLFTFYMWEQYGDDFIRNLVQSDRKGIGGINVALTSVNKSETFKDVLINWAVANYVNDRNTAEKYGYLNEHKGIKASPHGDHFQYPVKRENVELKGYAYKYIQFSSADSLKAKFVGERIVIKAVEYGTDFIEIKDIQPGMLFTEEEFGVSIYKIVFVIINTSLYQTEFSYDGTAVQSLMVQELGYDDGEPDPFSGDAYFLGFGEDAPGYGWAVKFKPPSPAVKLLNARIYIYSMNQDRFEFHIWDDRGFNNTPGHDIISPISVTPPAINQEMWVTVDLTPYGDKLTNFEGSFYVGIIQPDEGTVYIGLDNSNPDMDKTWALFGPSSITPGWYPMNLLSIYEIMEEDTTRQSLAGFNMMIRVKISVDVREIPPIAPKNLIGLADESEVKLEWSPNNEWDVSYYKVYRNTNTDFVPTQEDSIGMSVHPKTTFSDNNIQKGVVYFYKISAVDIDGKEGEPSNAVNVSPPLEGENILDSTSVVIWHFNEGKGNVIYDETLNNKDGSITNSVWIDDGKFGKALNFDGRFSAVEAGNVKIGKDSESFTIEMWYRLTDGYQNKDMVFITQGYRRKTIGKWYIKYNRSSKRIEGYVESTSGVNAITVTGKGLNVGKWHHIALVRDAENNKIQLYIDNELVDNADFSGILNVSNNYKTIIGKDARIIDYVRLSNFLGIIDEVRISNIAISDFGIITNIAEAGDLSLIPKKYNLYQNYPNPFNLSTKIVFDLPKIEFVSLKIYNLLGQVIRTLKNEQLDSGRHNVIWDGKNDKGLIMPSAVYFYELKTKSFTKIKKMTLIK